MIVLQSSNTLIMRLGSLPAVRLYVSSHKAADVDPALIWSRRLAEDARHGTALLVTHRIRCHICWHGRSRTHKRCTSRLMTKTSVILHLPPWTSWIRVRYRRSQNIWSREMRGVDLNPATIRIECTKKLPRDDTLVMFTATYTTRTTRPLRTTRVLQHILLKIRGKLHAMP